MPFLRRQRMAFEHRHDAAVGQRRARHVARQHGQPHAGAAGGEHGRQVVGAQRPSHRHGGGEPQRAYSMDYCVQLGFDNFNEFEDLAITPEDAPTAVALLN